jgi:hypothetical protein
MDNEIFRRTYREVNERFCPYEKSILTNQARCSRSERFCIAEREGVHCKSDAAQQQCLDLLELLRKQSRFALKASDDRAALPHGKAMRVQVGGLRGIYRFLHPDEPVPAPIPDIFELVEAARAQAQGLERLPFQEIVKAVAAYKGRPRSSSRRR